MSAEDGLLPSTRISASLEINEQSASKDHDALLRQSAADVFWEGKIEVKNKRKAPKDRLPSMISSTKYRALLLQNVANKTKKRGSKSSDEWQCTYC